MERKSQESSTRSFSYIEATATSGYKIMEGVNKDYYPLVVMNHKEYLTKLCIEKLELQPEVHWNIAMDYSQDSNNKVIYYLLSWLYGVEHFEFVPLGSVPKKKKPKRRSNLPRSAYQIGTRVWDDNLWIDVETPQGIRRRVSPQEYVIVGYPRANTWTNVSIQQVNNPINHPPIEISDHHLYKTREECQTAIDKRYNF